MTTPGTNSLQPVQSNFNGTFPLAGAAVGMLGTTGTMVPFNSDALGNLMVVFGGSISAASPSVSTTGLAVPAQADYIGVNVGGTLQAPVAVIVTTLNATAYVPRVDLSSMGGTALAIGQAPMATSIPVVIASNQSNLTTIIANASITALVSGTVTAVVSGTVAVTGTAVISGTASVNLIQVGGTAIALGQAVMATSIPVVLASNQSNITAVIASGTVTANLAAGSNAIGTVTALQLAPWSTNFIQLAGQTIATGGATGLFTVGGPAATNSAILGWPVMFGGRAQTAEIGTTTNGSAVMAAFDAVGKQIVSLYANKENYVAGATSSIATTLLQVIASVNATNRIYLTSMQFGNTSTATTVVLTFNDAKTSNFIVPAGGGSNINFPMALQFGLGSSVSFSTSVAVSTVYVNAQGFSGT